MVSERRENRSSRRSRRLIRQAFQELLEEREFSKITVVDIVQRADLNRSTFYAHYPDIYGIVDEIQDEIMHRNMELFQQLEFRNILKDPMPYLHCITATMEENLELMQKLGLTENVHRKTGKLLEMMEHDIVNHSDIPKAVRESSLFAIRVHFFMGGIMNTYQQWAAGKLCCTLDQVSSQIGDMIRQTATGFLETDWTRNL